MKKILLLFLSLSVYNSYASTEENDVEKFSRVIFSSDDLSEVITERTPLISPLCDHQTVVEIAQSFNPPKEYKEGYLSQLDKKGWESWIKKYGKYPGAIRVAAEYAEKNPEKWSEFQHQIVDGPSRTFKWFYAGTMTDRTNFFISVDENKRKQVFYRTLADNLKRVLTISQNSVRPEDVSSLSTRNKDLEQRILEQTKLNEELTKQISEQSKLIESFSSKFESLERSFETKLNSAIDEISRTEADKRAGLEESLRTEIEQRKALEQEITELREQMNKPVVQSEPGLTEFRSQIDDLKTQLGELKAIVGANNPDLAGKIQGLSDSLNLSKTVQNLSEKVAIDLESIKKQINDLTRDFADYQENSISPEQFDAFTVILLALRKLADPERIKAVEAEIKKQLEQE